MDTFRISARVLGDYGKSKYEMLDQKGKEVVDALAKEILREFSKVKTWVEGEELRSECKARRCFYKDAHQCQTDQGWHTYTYKDGIQFANSCDCECHKEIEDL